MKSRKTVFLTVLFAAWLFGVAALQAINADTLPDRIAQIDAAVAAADGS